MALSSMITITEKDKAGFAAWLEKNGCVIIDGKDPRSYVRVILPNGNIREMTTRPNGSAHLLGCLGTLASMYVCGVQEVRWDELFGGKATLTDHDFLVKKIARRDGGMRCIYCGKWLTLSTATIEHVVPKSAGGPSNMSNYVLACKECNQWAGSLSVAEKVRRMHALHQKQEGPEVPLERKNAQILHSLWFFLPTIAAILGLVFLWWLSC